MYGLDNYITDSRYCEWREELRCNKCDSEWEATICIEYGRSFFKDEDKMYCPECGMLEGTEVESDMEL